MRSIEAITIAPDMTILETIKIIDESSQQIGLVIGADNQLVGTVTDGDIRRGLLRGVGLEQPVCLVMNISPRTIKAGVPREKILDYLINNKLRQLPIVDDKNRVIGLERIDDLILPEGKDNWVILMAGGLGTRLGDLTKQCPKPLISVGGKPLLETIIENFKECGFRKFLLSVNYKADMIQSHFQDGSHLGVEIEYLHEPKRLGTAGALSLINKILDKPIIVMNGDLLTKVNFQQLMDYHTQHKSVATMCVRECNMQIPYGVVRIDGESLKAIDEKPVQSFFVNAGIYVLEPQILELIPHEEYFDMTSLFDEVIRRELPINVFPIREYWLDIGQRDDLERANWEYKEVFQ